VKIKRKKQNTIKKTHHEEIDKKLLLSKYKTINKPLYDDLVLIVIGGEYGVITTYLRDEFKYSGIIIIEPNPNFISNSVAQNNYRKLSKSNHNIKYITSPEIDNNSDSLLDLMKILNVFEKGLKIIYNPMYLELYEEKMKIEKEKLDNFLSKLKTENKGLTCNQITQKNNINEDELKDFFNLDQKLKLETLFLKEACDVGDGSFVVLIGGEYGLFLEYLLKNKPINNIYVIEPEDYFLKNSKAENIFKSIELNTGRNILKRFFITDTQNDELEFFQDAKSKLTFISNAKIIINPLYKTHEKLVDTVKITSKHLKSTVFAKGNSMADELYGMTNALYNLAYINKLKRLKKQNIDTIISVAAGPSLDNHMDELKKLSKKFPVIAVEVAANKLLKEGIFPDIICSQERTFKVTQITDGFHSTLKENSVFVAPILTHPYNVKQLSHVVLFSQNTKSPQEGYLSENVYSIVDNFDLSIYAGEVNLLTALQFNPKQILLFGHDLAFTEDKKYANNIDTEMQASEKDALKETGNRGQTVYLTYMFNKFRNNTETLLGNIKKKNDKVKFITFSEGAMVKHIENSKEGDFEFFLSQPNCKPSMTELLIPLDYQQASIKTFIDEEKDFINQQLKFLTSIDQLSDMTINAKFAKLFLQTHKLSNVTAHHLIDDFLSKHMYIQNNMQEWIKQHKDELLSIYKMIGGTLNKTENLINGKNTLPEQDKPAKELFDYNLFAVIRDKAFDEKEQMIEHLPKELLKYVLLSFYYAFESIDYMKMAKILGQLEPYIDTDPDAKLIYDEGMERQIYTYERKWEEIKNQDIEEKSFFRYQVASFNYKAGNIERVISFLESFDDLGYPEKVILADALSDNKLYQEAFKYYCELIKEKTSQRIIINALSCLISAEKYAEAWAFKEKFSKFVTQNQIFQKNITLLEEKIAELKRTSEKKLEIFEQLNFDEFASINMAYLNLSSDKTNEIMDLFSKQTNCSLFNLSESNYYCYKKNFNPDLYYFKLFALL